MSGSWSKLFVTGYKDVRLRTENRRSRKMYQNILIPVENSETDNTIIEHIRELARLTKAKLLLVHVADGWVARNYEHLELQESDEMRHDREYLENLEKELRSQGFEVSSVLAMGEP